MKRRSKTALSALELELMQVNWRLASGTLSAVEAGLTRPLAYTPVQTMPNIVERKRRLGRERRGRAYVYSARVTKAKALSHGVRDLIDRMFGGSTEELVMSLLKTGQIDAKPLAELTQRFDEEAKNS